MGVLCGRERQRAFRLRAFSTIFSNFCVTSSSLEKGLQEGERGLSSFFHSAFAPGRCFRSSSGDGFSRNLMVFTRASQGEARAREGSMEASGRQIRSSQVPAQTACPSRAMRPSRSWSRLNQRQQGMNGMACTSKGEDRAYRDQIRDDLVVQLFLHLLQVLGINSKNPCS